MAENNLITTEQMTRVRELDFAKKFGENINGFLNMLGVTRKFPATAGTVLKIREIVGTLQNGNIAEGEIIPLSQFETKETPIGELKLKKWRKATTAEAIIKSGYDVAVNETDKKAIREAQKEIRGDFLAFLNTATGGTTVVGAGLQEGLAQAWGQLQVKFEDDDITPVYFLNPLDVADYLGKKDVTTQNEFGFTYVQNFLNLGTVIMSPRINKGTFKATAAENIIAYYINVAETNGLGEAFAFTTDSETGFIGVHEEPDYKTMTEETTMCGGIDVFAEYPAGVISGEIDDSFLTDLTVAPDDSASYAGGEIGASDIQSDVSVSGGEVTGELKFIDGGIPALGFSDDGYYLGLKYSDFAEGLTYANVKVGIVPSAYGIDLQTLDSDKNSVFKVTNPQKQKVKVVQEDNAGHKNIQYFGLSGLTLEETEGA